MALVVDVAAYRWTHSPSQLVCLFWGLASARHRYSENQLGEISRWLCYDENTINVI